MDRQGHFSRIDHVLPGHVTNLGHVIAVGTQDAALAAQGAGVDGLVHHVVAHDDGDIVVDLSRQNPGEFVVVLQIGAALDALVAPALDAPAGFRHGRSFIHDRNAAAGDHALQAGVEPCLHAALLAPGVGGIEVLGHPIGGQSRLFRAEGRAQHALGFAGDQLPLPADHDGLIHFQAGIQLVRSFARRANQVIFRRSLGICRNRVCVPFKFDIQTAQIAVGPCHFRCQRRKHRLPVRELGIDRHRVHLLRQLTGQEQRKQIQAENGALLRLFPEQAPLFRRFAVLDGSALQSPDADALTQLPELALALAGRFAAGRQDMGEGGDLFIKGHGLVKIPRCNGGQHGLGVQLQGALRIAVGRLLMDTEGFSGFQLLLVKQPLLTVDMGRLAFFYNHNRNTPFRRIES